jgi:hypothetical protein
MPQNHSYDPNSPYLSQIPHMPQIPQIPQMPQMPQNYPQDPNQPQQIALSSGAPPTQSGQQQGSQASATFKRSMQIAKDKTGKSMTKTMNFTKEHVNQEGFNKLMSKTKVAAKWTYDKTGKVMMPMLAAMSVTDPDAAATYQLIQAFAGNQNNAAANGAAANDATNPGDKTAAPGAAAAPSGLENFGTMLGVLAAASAQSNANNEQGTNSEATILAALLQMQQGNAQAQPVAVDAALASQAVPTPAPTVPEISQPAPVAISDPAANNAALIAALLQAAGSQGQNGQAVPNQQPNVESLLSQILANQNNPAVAAQVPQQVPVLVPAAATTAAAAIVNSPLDAAGTGKSAPSMTAASYGAGAGAVPVIPPGNTDALGWTSQNMEIYGIKKMLLHPDISMPNWRKRNEEPESRFADFPTVNGWWRLISLLTRASLDYWRDHALPTCQLVQQPAARDFGNGAAVAYDCIIQLSAEEGNKWRYLTLHASPITDLCFVMMWDAPPGPQFQQVMSIAQASLRSIEWCSMDDAYEDVTDLVVGTWRYYYTYSSGYAGSIAGVGSIQETREFTFRKDGRYAYSQEGGVSADVGCTSVGQSMDRGGDGEWKVLKHRERFGGVTLLALIQEGQSSWRDLVIEHSAGRLWINGNKYIKVTG